jgi:simple sugar transport system ATP-binding protein
MDERYAVELVGASKTYGSINALIEADFRLRPGEVRALAGKNGAGKSTLIRLVSGAERLDRGELRLDGEHVVLHKPSDAERYGVACVYQELSVVKELSVAENICLGSLPVRGPLRLVDWKEAERRATTALGELGCSIDPDAEAGSLSIAEQQLVEISRALRGGVKVLILDEPTSSLSRVEAARLLEVVRTLADRGVAVIYVSHRMDEIKQIADAVTVLRDGRIVGELSNTEATPQAISRLMVGDDIVEPVLVSTDAEAHGDVVLQLDGLAALPRLTDLTLTVHSGEVVGLAGLLGSGRTEALQAIFGGQRAAVSGEVHVAGTAARHRSVRTMIRRGVGLVPEDRRAEGLVMTTSVAENLEIPSWPTLARVGVISRKPAMNLAARAIQDFSIKVAHPDVNVGTLSGGNQQKVVIGKWVTDDLRLLLLDQPTRGVDVHAKQQIYRIIRDVAAAGAGVLFVSDELEEYHLVCDKVVVLVDGKGVAEMDGRDATAETLMKTITEAAEHDRVGN